MLHAGHQPETTGADAPRRVRVRPFTETDRSFLAEIAPRMFPRPTGAACDRDAFRAYFDRLGRGQEPFEPGSENVVAEDAAGRPLGFLSLGQEADHFTKHGRAHVHALVVAEQAEGLGVGRALMDYAEEWARARGLLEVVLEVFATNDRAIGFYHRLGFRPDFLRLAKPVRDPR